MSQILVKHLDMFWMSYILNLFYFILWAPSQIRKKYWNQYKSLRYILDKIKNKCFIFICIVSKFTFIDTVYQMEMLLMRFLWTMRYNDFCKCSLLQCFWLDVVVAVVVVLLACFWIADVSKADETLI